MSVSSREGRRLKAFRLSDVPIETRRRAAKKVARGPATSDRRPAEDKLFATLLDLRGPGDDAVLEAAERPSERVYWISAAAWEQATRSSAWGRT